MIVRFGVQTIAGIDDLHRHLTGEQVGVRSPVMVIRHTEKLEMEIVPADSAMKSRPS
jgi:hypothetical protein